MNRFLKSEDDDNDFAPEERIYAEKKGFSVWYIIIGILALIPYICIPILFAMVYNIDQSGDTNNYYANSVVSTFTNTKSLSNGKVVSLTSDGEIQLGAGTSIYKNIVDMNFLCPSYLSMDAIYDDTYLISYANKQTMNSSTLQVVYVDAATPSFGEQVLIQQNVGYYIYEIITLSKVDGIFVGICQDYSNVTENAYIITGKLIKNENNYEIKLQPSATPYTSVYSVDPTITRMSDNSFAIVYYNYDNYKVETSYGYVNDQLETTLYEGKGFINDTSSGIYFSAIGLSPISYLIFYYKETYKVDEYYGYGVLNTLLVTVNTNEEILLFSNSTELKDSAIVFSLSATMIDNHTAIVTYTDALQNYAIICQTINVQTDVASDITDIVYGSSWKVTTGETLAVKPSGMMDIDIEKISDNQFMVLFSDISNNGIMTATTGELTASGEIIRASADFLLNNGNKEFSHYYTWGSLAAGVTTTYSSSTAILTSKTNFDCSLYASTTFSMMEIKPTPYGITTSKSSLLSKSKITPKTPKNNEMSNRKLTSMNQYSSILWKNDLDSKDKTINVIISGVIRTLASNILDSGMVYYSNTMGDIINSKTYVGRSSYNEFSYIVDDETNTIITYNSKVGFSISSNSLYLQINN